MVQNSQPIARTSKLSGQGVFIGEGVAAQRGLMHDI
jgi:hypothetical protein